MTDVIAEPFVDSACDPPVRGVLHRPARATGDGIVLTHGAGANCHTTLLCALAATLAANGLFVLRCDLPFRQRRPCGPPGPGDAARDRAGLENAVDALKSVASGRIFLGGHSYGGRQATMLCADHPGEVAGLLLLSYPLHPPRQPEKPRTQHLPHLHTPALFVHGTRDPFGSIEEMEAALKFIPAKTRLLRIEGAGHDLGFKGKAAPVAVVESVRAGMREVFGDV